MYMIISINFIYNIEFNDNFTKLNLLY